MKKILTYQKGLMMSLRLVVLLMLAMLPTLVWGEPVGQEAARQKAAAFLGGRAQARGGGATDGQQLSVAYTSDEYHVFNRGQHDGFVIVSGDDCAPDILGYSDSGHFNEATMPDNMRAWMKGYKEQIRMLRASGVKYTARAKTRNGEERKTIAPLLTSNWNQDDPYNLQTPIKNGMHCVTGCVATAMAQVMYYWYRKIGFEAQLEQDISTYYSERLNSYVEGFSAPATFDWVNMTDTYDENSTEASRQAVAKLMSYCGRSVEMNYGLSSGAYPQRIAEALKDNYGYVTALYLSREWFTDEEWTDILYNELAAERPVLYGGHSDQGGHRFVCDGFDGDECFHFNWGWGGTSDGYFKLDLLNPHDQGIGGGSSSSSYSNRNSMVICHPNEGFIQDINPEFTQCTIECTSINVPVLYKNTEDKVIIKLKNSDKSNIKFHGSIQVEVNSVNRFYKRSYVEIESDNTLELKIPVMITNIGKYTLTVSRAKQIGDKEQGAWVKLKEKEVNVAGLELKGEATISRSDNTLSCDINLYGQYSLFGITNTIAVNPSTVHVTWQEYDEVEGAFKDALIAATCSFKKTDYGKKVRAKVTVDGYDEVIYSAGYELQKEENNETPVPPQLEAYSGSVKVKYAVPSQEYIILNYQKAITALTESDWANAVSPAKSGAMFMEGFDGFTNYVYTRKKETDHMKAGTNVDRGSVYLGADTYFHGISLKVELVGGSEGNYYYSEIFEKENGAYYVKVGDVLRLTASPVPATYTPFWGIATSRWINNKKGGAFYEDAACETPLQDYTNYTQVFYRAEKQMDYNDVSAEYTNGGTTYRDAFDLHVADENGIWLVDRITPATIDLDWGWKQFNIPVRVHPLGATLSNVEFVVDESNSSEGKAPVVIYDDQRQMIVNNDYDADPGTYYFNGYQDGRNLGLCVVVNMIAPAVEGVKIPYDGVRADRGAKVQMEMKPIPSNATPKSVVWSVDDESIATIDNEGLLTIKDDAPKGIVTTIRVMVDGKYKADCALIVPLHYPELWFEETKAYAVVGQPFTPPVLNNPANLPVKYSTDASYFGFEETIAMVDKNTGTITPIGVGNTYVYADFYGNDEYESTFTCYRIIVYAKGDVNRDGKVDQTDVDLTAQHILGKKPDGFFEAAAHMNDDGVINAADLVLIVAEANKP